MYDHIEPYDFQEFVNQIERPWEGEELVITDTRGVLITILRV